MIPLSNILTNKLQLQETFSTNEAVMDDWPFWLLEENIKVANKIIEDKEKNRKTEEDKQKTQMPNMDTSSMTNNMSSMMNKFKK
jgi:hypothetical protein